MSSPAPLCRYAIVGVGSRATFYYAALVKEWSTTCQLVAFCDSNQTRMDFANDNITTSGHPAIPTYKEDLFDTMIAETKPDTVIVTVIDKFHHVYCIRALELGCNAVVEKPMTIDPDKLQAMIDAVKSTGREIRVAFNYRYAPHNTKVKELIQDGTIGTITQVHFEWLLDTHHGSDFFRRWHRMKENSGGLLLSKSIHHFDLATFWVDSEPDTVFAMGDLSFYGPDNAEKQGIPIYERTHGTDNAAHDPYALKMDQSRQLSAMYLAAEKEDGYIRDRSVWSEGITIEDTLGVMCRYKDGTILTYSTNAYSPYEGFQVNLTGTKGRIELNVVEGQYIPGREASAYGFGLETGNVDAPYVHGGVEQKTIKVFPIDGQPYTVDIPQIEGNHGGADPLLLADMLAEAGPDRFKRAAFIREAGQSTLIGMGGNISIETGMPCKVQGLVRF